MATNISDQAAVDPRAQLGDDVEIGPFCMVGPDVTIGAGSRLMNNVTLTGRVTVGENNQFFPGVVIGAALIASGSERASELISVSASTKASMS